MSLISAISTISKGINIETTQKGLGMRKKMILIWRKINKKKIIAINLEKTLMGMKKTTTLFLLIWKINLKRGKIWEKA